MERRKRINFLGILALPVYIAYGGIYLIIGLVAAAFLMVICLLFISPMLFAIYSVLCGIDFPITIAYTENIDFGFLRLYVYAALALSDAIWHPIKNLGTLLLGLGITQIFYFLLMVLYHALDEDIFKEEHDKDPVSYIFYHAFGLGVIEGIGNWYNKMKELFEDKLIINPLGYGDTRRKQLMNELKKLSRKKEEQQDWDEGNRIITELIKLDDIRKEQQDWDEYNKIVAELNKK